MIGYKFLRHGGVSPFTGFRWPLPASAGERGPWVEAAGETGVCRDGIHACRVQDLPYWLGPELWTVELDGALVAGRSKVSTARARLLRRIAAWDGELRWAYCEMCAERARERIAGSPLLQPWGAAIEPSMREGPALLGFIAARIAEEDEGRDAYYAERAHQVRWLVEQLGLEQA